MALGHYHSHLNIARELKDAAGIFFTITFKDIFHHDEIQLQI